MSLHVVPITPAEANGFVARHHRHRGRVVGSLFSIGVAAGGELVGVVVVSRPVARMLQDGYTAEITRLCTNGHPNACSKLYAAAAKASMALGYRRLVTYTLASENGASLRASGWRVVAQTAPRGDWHPTGQKTGDRSAKLRWEAVTATTESRNAQNVRQRCRQCGKGIALVGAKGKRRDARYCSGRCRQRAYRRR